MKVYQLKNKEMPWGDYGDMLLKGMTEHLGRKNGLLQLERTGPFIPLMSISGLNNLLITEPIRRLLEDEKNTGIKFRPVIKAHISLLDWQQWDVSAEDPPMYPENGAPENYILEEAHSQKLADEMDEVWEIEISNANTYGSTIFKKGLKIFISPEFKHWIERNCGEWVQFVEVDTESLI